MPLSNWPAEAWIALGLIVVVLGLVALYAIANGQSFSLRFKQGDAGVDVGVGERKRAAQRGRERLGDIRNVDVLKDGKIERSSNTTIQVGHTVKGPDD